MDELHQTLRAIVLIVLLQEERLPEEVTRITADRPDDGVMPGQLTIYFDDGEVVDLLIAES